VAPWFPSDDAIGTIYLVHFSAPTVAHRQHYLGWSADVTRRFAQHCAGHGARQTRKALAEGLRLTLAQTWRGTPSQERRIKDEHRRARRSFAWLCPFCEGDDCLPGSVIAELGPPTLRVVKMEALASHRW
jgi:predicted GIY-YIG superfamily endonuclease